MMGVGMMIGAGAVIGMGLSIRLAGPGGTLLAFAFDGMVALFTAMSYAEMSSAVPKAGSIYNFARIAFGRGTGFTAGWISWFASSVAGTFYLVICAEYSVDFLAQLGLLD
jgi:APA family basic amino acid/polyamine antiporter